MEAARKKELSPFSLIRTEFNNTKIDKSVEMKNEGVKHVLYNWNDTFHTFNTAVQKVGSGNFQGFHRKIWEKIGGYAEGPWVFHTDTALMLELSSLSEITLITKYLGSYHIEHKLAFAYL